MILQRDRIDTTMHPLATTLGPLRSADPRLVYKPQALSRFSLYGVMHENRSWPLYEQGSGVPTGLGLPAGDGRFPWESTNRSRGSGRKSCRPDSPVSGISGMRPACKYLPDLTRYSPEALASGVQRNRPLLNSGWKRAESGRTIYTILPPVRVGTRG